jgi:hypothetical protein
MPMSGTSYGLPGVTSLMRGGRTRSMRHKGGRYTTDIGIGGVQGSNGVGITPGGMRIPCEGPISNSLNKMYGGMFVGDSNNRAYYAPTAGYRNDFGPLGGSVNPGVMTVTPYDARASNQACTKTGGGNGNMLKYASESTPLSLDQIGNRREFDGTIGGLPVRFGGKRRRSRRSN